MNRKIIQLRQSPITVPKNGFAGREVLAELLNKRSAPARDDQRAEIEEMFRALSGGPGSLPVDSARIERDLKDALGVPVTVIELPKPAMSQRSVERLSTELKRIEEAKRSRPQNLPEKSDPLNVSAEVAEEFASLSVQAHLPYSSAAACGKAEADMSNIAGVCMSVRSYPKSKKKDYEGIDRE